MPVNNTYLLPIFEGRFFYAKQKAINYIKKMVAIAIFAALAYVVHFIHIPVGFLNLDFKDVLMAIGGMYFGPIAGLVLSVLVPVLEFPTSSTGIYGLIMNIISSATFVCVASVIYKFNKKLSGAIIGLSAAALATTAMMMLANLFITPYYMGVTRADVVGLLPTLLLPFNGTKSVLNAALTLCLYKPVTLALRKTGLGKAGVSVAVEAVEPAQRLKRSVLVWVIAGSIAVAALCVIFFVLGGKIAIN